MFRKDFEPPSDCMASKKYDSGPNYIYIINNSVISKIRVNLPLIIFKGKYII